MSRLKKSEEDQKINCFVGKRVSSLRLDKGLGLNELAGQLGISAAHLKSLESGRYSFSAHLLYKLALALGRPVSAFMPGTPRRGGDTLADTWSDLYDALTTRDRKAILDMGRKLADTGGYSVLQWWKKIAAGSGRLISMEGIDGVILEEQGRRLVDHLKTKDNKGNGAELCLYDFDNQLWQFMNRRFRETEVNPSQAFERTLFFACERIHRQEKRIRPLLSQGTTVVTLFFSIAPMVYQQMEGLLDMEVVQAISNYILEPDLIIYLDSDAAVAAGRAVPHRPGPGQFWSPYCNAGLLKRAGELYQKAIDKFGGCSTKVYTVNADQDIHRVAARINQIVNQIIKGSSLDF